MSFYPPLPTDPSYVRGFYATRNNVNGMCHELQDTRWGFLAVHVCHALWANWVGHEFTTECLVDGSRSDWMKYYIGVRFDYLNNSIGGRALSHQMFRLVTILMCLIYIHNEDMYLDPGRVVSPTSRSTYCKYVLTPIVAPDSYDEVEDREDAVAKDSHLMASKGVISLFQAFTVTAVFQVSGDTMFKFKSISWNCSVTITPTRIPQKKLQPMARPYVAWPFPYNPNFIRDPTEGPVLARELEWLRMLSRGRYLGGPEIIRNK
ncbi:hypothetical protein K466DRAFT_569925 [Polyporus arcularius HHB13444]|uniref:Uncharacterized protein n=1 Tax=Polyporus arcularius HHB13444 TaxID=1314778 RepID=A0A5C3NRK5_9APHY|nr:hypothetical protein K466DRAFT_569925 [Polyporus arcularius HHB13444]